MTPEGVIKREVKKLLTVHDAYWHCPVQNGMGAPTLDFICCHNGLYLAIETKAGGKSLTPRQQQTSEHIRQAGGVVFVVDGDASLAPLEQWLLTYKCLV